MPARGQTPDPFQARLEILSNPAALADANREFDERERTANEAEKAAREAEAATTKAVENAEAKFADWTEQERHATGETRDTFPQEQKS